MKYFLDMQNVKIAEKLGLTKAAVDNRIYRGKQVMRKKGKYFKIQGVKV
jgi:RNA polymerase sigma-70 factor (ECF subfamily)